ncbi:hypothetical protein LTR08_009285 [Meristemomyces frigidus]|nr:hypothetical protein LTR08_009285 [Meristemomyces frigidus]
MFYSHEVLTSRRTGVATVWLVATLGAKSTLKRVSRKAILDVDVQKACATIVEPAAPMALRLQSNLLYGVARVYSQQCGYVLTDAEAAKASMRAMISVLRTSALEAEGGHKGRLDQLILQDDPNFLPDFDLMPIDLDNLNFDLSTNADVESQRSTLSPHHSQSTLGSQQMIGGLQIPGVSSSLVGGPVGGFGGAFSVRGDSGAGGRVDDGGWLEDDLGLDVGEGLFGPGMGRQPAAPSARADRTDVGSVSSVVRREHEGGQLGRDILGRADDDGFMPLQDDYVPNPDAQAFPARPDSQQPPHQTTTSETADAAPLRRRARAAPKVIAPDATLELRNSELARWHTDYVANMQHALRHKEAGRALAVAKRNAEVWVLGSGTLGALGQADRLVQGGPLGMFSGAKLLEAFTAFRLAASSSGAGAKRSRVVDEEEEGAEGSRRVRSRGMEQQPSSEELGRGGVVDDGYQPMQMDDVSAAIEQGREAPTPLEDRRLSSALPWNQSTGSRRPTGVFASTSIAGAAAGTGAHLPGRRASRLLSASPLVGRGTLPGTGAGANMLDELMSQHHALHSDLFAAAANNDNNDGEATPANDVPMPDLEAFELSPPPAALATHTPAHSQSQRATLATENANFLAFVHAGIAAADAARELAGGAGDEDDKSLQGSVEFAALLPEANNSAVVAAQGLMHVLALGTKGLLAVEQEGAFGGIVLRGVGGGL